MNAKLHAFVAMPFGQKPDADGTLIDFNDIYIHLIKPALDQAGFEIFRADEEQRAGEIRADMFQELLIADLVVADLTLDNPNVWYELGVRHALRARGILLIQGPRPYQPFDIYTDRKVCYHLKQGKLDPELLNNDIAAITASAKATLAAWHGRKISPVYALLPNLSEPNWKSLQVGNVCEFWQKHGEWEKQIKLAQKDGHIGDILVLADEAPISALRHEATLIATKALRNAEAFGYALEKVEEFLKNEPDNPSANHEKGICLQRLSLLKSSGITTAKARQHYDNYLHKNKTDSEAWGLRGRVDKDAWEANWINHDNRNERINAAKASSFLLKSAIESYFKGVQLDLRNYFPAINSLTLMVIYRHLLSDHYYDEQIDTLAKLISFNINSRTEKDFWSLATLGDVALLSGTLSDVTDAYGRAIAEAGNNRFKLSSTRKQLLLLDALGIEPKYVKPAIKMFDEALEKLPAASWIPKRVLLFSGHMIDHPDREQPRFPAAKEPEAKAAIAGLMDEMDVGENDLVICQASAGSDILFLEACRDRGARLNIYLPFEEPIFIKESIAPLDSNNNWRSRFLELKSGSSVRVMPNSLGVSPAGVNAYERCNLWTLYTALSHGLAKVHFVCLWNGKGGDGPGGTAHMYKEVERRTGQVHWLNPEQLFQE